MGSGVFAATGAGGGVTGAATAAGAATAGAGARHFFRCFFDGLRRGVGEHHRLDRAGHVIEIPLEAGDALLEAVTIGGKLAHRVFEPARLLDVDNDARRQCGDRLRLRPADLCQHSLQPFIAGLRLGDKHDGNQRQYGRTAPGGKAAERTQIKPPHQRQNRRQHFDRPQGPGGGRIRLGNHAKSPRESLKTLTESRS